MKHARVVLSFWLAALWPTALSAQTQVPHATESREAAPGSLAAALAAVRATDYAAAEKALSAVTGAERPIALLALARVMFERGRFKDAERYAVQAMSSPACRLSAIAFRGEILAAQGKVEQAIQLLDPEKDAAGVGGRQVRLELGEVLIRAGRRADAEPVLLKFADEYSSDAIVSTDAEGLAMVGRAMHLLRHAKDANRAYNESERAERGRVQTLLWRADLYLDKYDPGHAEEVLAEALKVAPHRADAMVTSARVKLGEALDFDAAEKLVRDALAVNPYHTGAYAVRAGIALRDGNLDRANAAIDAGLAIDPNDLELLSLRAAARFLADDRPGFEKAKEEVFARNKEFSQAYGIISEYAEWEHRYGDVVAMMNDAVVLDPSDSKAWAQLGMMQTRSGDEAAGVASLERAWQKDHFNVRVYNTLQLLYRQWIPQKYESGRDGVFDIRYPKAEKAVLERYVPQMLAEAWAAMKVHYMFVPRAPAIVEMYGEREHFSVRTSGLPNIGIQGVCFGQVVAAMSPDSEAFNWGNVLWHELAHVFAIQLSNSHVPRWFTEGLSEYETMIRRPEWRRELDPEFYLALKRRGLPGALEMNAAFTHADGALDVTIAYYAASQMLAFTADRFGFPRITQALELWGQGKTTRDVIREAFGVTPSEYDAAFRAWALARLARYDGQYLFDPRRVTVDEGRALAAATPQVAEAHVAYALALLRARKTDEAAREVAEAFKIDPNDKDAHFVAAKLAAMEKDLAKQEEHIAAITAAGGDGYTIEAALAEVAGARHDKVAARAAFEAAHRFDPTQAEPLRGLYEIATEEKRDADALAALEGATRLDQHDRRGYRLLLDKLVAAKRWNDAKRVGQSLLYLDVESAAMHTTYARALSATGDHETAAFELESALLCDAKREEKVAAHALLAQERLALGDSAAARAHRDEALRLDPQNAEARALQIR